MMGTMTRTARITRPRMTLVDADAATNEQLTLLPTTSTPARFQLSRETRERGLRHVAEIRQMLATSAHGAPGTEQAA